MYCIWSIYILIVVFYNNIFQNLFYSYNCGCFAYVYVCVPCACLVLDEARRGCPETEGTEGYEPLCGCWESDQGHLEEQPMLLTAVPSLQPSYYKF